MPYSANGSVVTQSGTDTSLSGLSGLPGVTVLQNSGDQSLAVYKFGTNLTLAIDGDLTFNPYRECIVTEARDTGGGRVIVNGRLVIDDRLSKFGGVSYGSNLAIRFTDSGGSPWNGSGHLVINGTFEQYGGFIAGPYRVAWNNGLASFKLRNAIWGGDTNNSEEVWFVHCPLTNFDIVGWTIISAKFEFAGSAFDAINFQGVKYQSSTRGFSTGGPAPGNVFWELTNYQGVDMLMDFAFNRGKWARFINSPDIKWGRNNTSSSANGLGEEVHLITVEPLLNGSIPDGVVVYVEDVDSGVRADYASQDYLNNRVYKQSTSAGRVDFDLLVAVQRSLGTTLPPKDVRFPNRTAVVYIAGYGYQLTSADYVAGAGTADDRYIVSALLAPDLNISEPDPQVVRQYTSIGTAEELYDAAVLDLVEGYAGERQTTITRSGSVIDARSLDVVVDPNANVDYELTGGTMTVKSNALLADITTTGTVTELNGAIIRGVVTDANGTRAPAVTGTLRITGAVPGSRVILYDSEGIGSPDWAAETAYAVGDRINPPASDGGVADLVTFRATTAGTSGTTRPSFPTTPGDTVSDGGVTWEAVDVAIVNDTADGSGELTYSRVIDASTDEAVTVAVYYVDGLTAKEPFVQATSLTPGTTTVRVAQVDNDAYILGGVDGSTVTEASVDPSGKIQIDVTDPDNVTTVQRIRNWFEWQKFEGTRAMLFPSVSGDVSNVVFAGSLTIENRKTQTLFVDGGFMRRADNEPIFDPAGGFVETRPEQVYVGRVSGDGTGAALTAAQEAALLLARDHARAANLQTKAPAGA